MKKLSYLFCLLMGLGMITFFSGCSDDDEDALLGTWYLVHDEGYEYDNGVEHNFSDYYDKGSILITFRGDGTYLYIDNINREEERGTYYYDTYDQYITFTSRNSTSEAAVLKIDRELILEYSDEGYYLSRQTFIR